MTTSGPHFPRRHGLSLSPATRMSGLPSRLKSTRLTKESVSASTDVPRAELLARHTISAFSGNVVNLNPVLSAKSAGSTGTLTQLSTGSNGRNARLAAIELVPVPQYTSHLLGPHGFSRSFVIT